MKKSKSKDKRKVKEINPFEEFLKTQPVNPYEQWGSGPLTIFDPDNVVTDAFETTVKATEYVISDIMGHVNEQIIAKNMLLKVRPWIIATTKEHILCLTE